MRLKQRTLAQRSILLLQSQRRLFLCIDPPHSSHMRYGRCKLHMKSWKYNVSTIGAMPVKEVPSCPQNLACQPEFTLCFLHVTYHDSGSTQREFPDRQCCAHPLVAMSPSSNSSIETFSCFPYISRKKVLDTPWKSLPHLQV